MTEVYIQTDHLRKAEVSPFLCRVCPADDQPGFTPVVPSASLADAQSEIARLRGALEEINRTTFDDDANRIAHSALQK